MQPQEDPEFSMEGTRRRAPGAHSVAVRSSMDKPRQWAPPPPPAGQTFTGASEGRSGHVPAGPGIPVSVAESPQPLHAGAAQQEEGFVSAELSTHGGGSLKSSRRGQTQASKLNWAREH